ncbi:MBL fold metallo-hydrolase [Paenibacillus sp. N1-5-1-14]|uniref:MBL fold metallo-hydrolase n=1 Tax=Paenibacillus radicibacter TaxID=2972488 RepID=UPI002158D86F|nr:MBL fold metallo-hydrolase [Paenibacillus radicibacter]MCR8644208.1 MBL fold metallo-hydrolase [Paenibacillus radicibacter]
MREVTTWRREGLLQVRVPLPFPLRWVNAYVIRGDQGYTILDPGLHTPEAEALWDSVLREEGILDDQVEQVVLTHFHPDHYGMAGWFQERTGAPVLLSEEGCHIASLLWGLDQPMTRLLTDCFAQHGLPAELQEQMTKHMDGFVQWVSPQPKLTPLQLRTGDTIRLGDRLYEAIETPGHASGHLCFYNREAKEIFCGDHVISHISPNVGYTPGDHPNPLQQFIESLQAVAHLEVDIAYSGHREPLTNFNERVQELMEHHDERLAHMENLLQESKTAYELCVAVFGTRLTIHQLRFALAETLAHILYLQSQDRVKQTEQDGKIYFQS